MTTTIDLNADMGESFGAWSIGDGVDADIMPLIGSANIAAGFHAGDPVTMRTTLQLANRYGVGIGVHPGFRDLAPVSSASIVSPNKVRISSSDRVKSPDLANPRGNLMVS